MKASSRSYSRSASSYSALQIVDVAEPRVRADDLQADVAGDVLLLQLDGAAADLLRPIELPVPREQQRQLQVRVAGLRIELDRAFEHRNRGGEVPLADPERAREPLVGLAVVRIEPERLPDLGDRLVDRARASAARAPSHMCASARSGSIASARRSISIAWLSISGMLRKLPFSPYAPPSAAHARAYSGSWLRRVLERGDRAIDRIAGRLPQVHHAARVALVGLDRPRFPAARSRRSRSR